MQIDLNKRHNLGYSGLKVPPLCVGTMMFGVETPATDARRILDHAFDHSVNFVDTADVYHKGLSEEIVGQAIQERRQDWILASKAGNPMSGTGLKQGLSRRWMMQALEDSLMRLGTEWIDIWYLHLADHETPLEETVLTIGQAIQSGKIRYWGISNFRAWQIAELARQCDLLSVPRPIVCQPYYNALNRMPEVEILPACEYYGIGVVPYSPLARGVLTGKYRVDQAPEPGSRAGRNDARIMSTEFREESLRITERLMKHTCERGTSMVAYALLWLLNNRNVTSVIAGPRTFEQWESYIAAFDADFTKEDEDLLNSLVPAGHPSTPGYNDPKYPITGRPVNTPT